MKSIAWLLLLVAAGCSCGRQAESDAGIDCCDTWDYTVELPDSQPDLPAEDLTEIETHDTSVETTPDAVFDPPVEPFDTDCHELEQDFVELYSLELTPLPPSTRAPKDCGPGCRQVSFAEHSMWGDDYSVWGKYLVFTTAVLEYETITTVHLVDLDTLDEYILASNVSDRRSTPPVDALLSFDGTLFSPAAWSFGT